jgi:hypothetical protein
VGFDADLALLDEDLRVVATFREGRSLYARGPRPLAQIKPALS